MSCSRSRASGTPPEARQNPSIWLYTIADLPEHFRVAIVLEEVLELSVEETAAILGVAENIVETRLRRARLVWRKFLLANVAARLCSCSQRDTGAIAATRSRRGRKPVGRA